MALFSKLIICGKCGKKHKFKKIRSKQNVYIDSTYDNKGKNYCERQLIHESLLIELLQMRFKKEEIGQELISEKVDYIEVNGNNLTINIKNEEPIIFSENYIQIQDLGSHSEI